MSFTERYSQIGAIAEKPAKTEYQQAELVKKYLEIKIEGSSVTHTTLSNNKAEYSLSVPSTGIDNLKKAASDLRDNLGNSAKVEVVTDSNSLKITGNLEKMIKEINNIDPVKAMEANRNGSNVEKLRTGYSNVGRFA
jgi:hypothetical protein